MTAFANITINDGQATPVAHTFSPRKIGADGVAKWQDLSGGIAVGFPTLTAQIREPIRGSKVPTYRVTIRLQVPTLETISNSTVSGILPAPTKAYDTGAELVFLLPERGTTAQRKDVVAYAKNILSQADIVAMLNDLSFVY